MTRSQILWLIAEHLPARPDVRRLPDGQFELELPTFAALHADAETVFDALVQAGVLTVEEC